MGNEKEDRSSAFGGRKRLRENGSQTDEDDHVAAMTQRSSTDARFDVLSDKLDRVLSACKQIESLKSEIITLRSEVIDLKDSLNFDQENITQLQTELAKTTATVEEHGDDLDSMYADIEALKRRNTKLEAYIRRENMQIYNVNEESEENIEDLVRNLFVSKMQIPPEAVKAIRFERVHRIPTKTSSQRSQSRPRPVIARFSHYQDKEFVRSFYKNLKGTDIGISDDFPKEIEDIHKTLYPVLKKAKRDQKKAFFNFDKHIIDGQLYRGKETKNLPYYGNIMKNFVYM